MENNFEIDTQALANNQIEIFIEKLRYEKERREKEESEKDWKEVLEALQKFLNKYNDICIRQSNGNVVFLEEENFQSINIGEIDYIDYY